MFDTKVNTHMKFNSFEYQGNELELFENATVWKKYWSSIIAEYIGSGVLEVGAGIGSNTKLLVGERNVSWHCLEPDPGQCEQIKAQIASGGLPPTVKASCGFLSDIDKALTFDTILYLDVLEHIESDRAELEAAAGHLKDRGHLIVLSPAHNSLFSKFDTHVGHWRRYDKSMLSKIVPRSLSVKSMLYLDSMGMAASLANKVLLRSSLPSPGQIDFWDKVLVRGSKVLDPLLLRRFGKTIICVLSK